MLSSEERRRQQKLDGEPSLKDVYESQKSSPEDAKTYDKLSNIMDVPQYKINNTIKKQIKKKKLEATKQKQNRKAEVNI